jgi:prepilin-type N-terminal cleavage/methylation domain-containing protein
MKLRRQSGFTALEMMVSIALLGIFVYVTAPMLMSTLNSANKLETDHRIKDVQETLRAAYRINAFEIDSEPSNQLTVGGQPVLLSGAIATSTTLAWAEKYAASSTTLVYKDGYGRPWMFYVSNRLSNVVNGTTLYSHKIAIVSEGRNGRFDDGTSFDPTTGLLTLKGDDVGAVVDGFEVQSALFDLTKRRIDTLASAYQSYFLTRFQSNESRNLTVNYFAKGTRGSADSTVFDTTGSVPTSGGADAAAADILGPTLGLSAEAYQDAYGQSILIDNSSDSVRTPDNSNAGMQAPPYSVVLKTTLPGSVVATQAIIGTY